MQNLRKWGAWLGAGAVLCTLAGCADNNNNGQAETPATANQVPGAVADNFGDTANAVTGAAGAAGNAVSNGVTAAGGAVTNGVAAAGGAVSNGVSAAGNAAAGAGKMAANALNTGDVKTSIMANQAMAGSNINVTTKDKMVMLNGTVKSAAQKNMASAVAKRESTGYTVQNNLKVGS